VPLGIVEGEKADAALFPDSILSVLVMTFIPVSLSVTRQIIRLDGVQLGDFLVGEAEFLEHLVGVLADGRGVATILLGVRDSATGWPTKVCCLPSGLVAFCAIPRCLTCSSAKVWSMV